MEQVKGTEPTAEQRHTVRVWYAQTCAMFNILADLEETHAARRVYEIMLDHVGEQASILSAEGIAMWAELHTQSLEKALAITERNER